MSDLKRDQVKYIRDAAKARYKKGTACKICGISSDLDFHHFYSISELWSRWVKLNKIKIDDVEDIMNIRHDFIAEHEAELYEHTVTLCHEHHLKLHSVYGRNPSLGTAKKQGRWVERQRDKHGVV